MRFDLVTLFPDIFDSFLRESLIGKALAKKAFEVQVIGIRDFTTDRHRTADDRPFGGGPGMVLKPEPLAGAIRQALAASPPGRSRVLLLSPSGRTLTQALVENLAGYDHLVLVCGRYEGVDERVVQTLIDEELSLGDYILSGGEVPAMAVVEAVARLLPGVVGKEESIQEETFQSGILEYPHYTRPRVFQGLAVPETLLSGDHAAIKAWRLDQAVRRTAARRPDLLARPGLPAEVKAVWTQIQAEDRTEELGPRSDL
ncbi:MAG: tRNA (guanosine(37)-N1)-methyltransferase TrmD [Thermodesulfobacteriota bacterium]